MNYIDLFSGSGGLSLGFEKAGFDNLFSVEFNQDAAATYRLNFPKHKLIQRDIKTITNNEIISLSDGKTVDIIIGGPPCQGFSIAGNIGRKFLDDPRNHLFREFVRFVKVLKPKYFLLENVARLYNHNKGKTLDEILNEFRNLGYNLNYKVIQSYDYGIPQKRRRIVILGSIYNIIEFPFKTKEKISIKEAIDNLPKLSNGQKSDIPNHQAMNHTIQMLEKMSYVPDGGDRTFIPKSIRPKSGDARKYIRYKSSEPSFCITGDMRKIFHYDQNRALTARELARIQTFPDDFVFVGSSISIQQQIGNAVPPKLAFIFAKEINNHEKNNKVSHN